VFLVLIRLGLYGDYVGEWKTFLKKSFPLPNAPATFQKTLNIGYVQNDSASALLQNQLNLKL
jgi:hypothetical protein